MDVISGNVTTTQEISGEVSLIKSVSGEATLLQATWTSISGKPFDSLDESDFEVVDGVLKVIGGGGGGGGTSVLCWLPSVSADGVVYMGWFYEYIYSRHYNKWYLVRFNNRYI